MYFVWPEFLWALVAIPLLVGGYLWLLGRRHISDFVVPSLELLRPALNHQKLWRRHVPPALLLLALTVSIVGLARPFARVALPADFMTLVMALDVSRSMLSEDVKPSRIVAAQSAAKAFIQDLPPNVRLGIVSFAGSAQVAQDVTDQRDELTAAIDRFQLQRGTATGSGLLLALATLLPEAGINLEAYIYGQDFVDNYGMGGAYGSGSASKARPLGTPDKEDKNAARPLPVGSYTAGAIILLSDGRRTAGPDPLEIARLVADRGVRVYTVAFGTPNGFIPGMEGVTFYTRVDEESLQSVAKITGGEFFRASNADDLKAIYEKLSSRITLEKRESEVSVLFAMVAFLLIVAAGSMSLIWFPRTH